MPHFTHYICTTGLLPIVEQALLAHGYTYDPLLRTPHGTTITHVLHYASTTVLLVQPPHYAIGEIEIWGPGQSAVANILDTLAINPHRLPRLSPS
ncbi:hypothetical protein F8S13_27230 [Chloroflexia bacterium SDU3-3]|nr:hypothetical protein F8S13_27230 [Chloroflexia bacterium SDU3-3]